LRIWTEIDSGSGAVVGCYKLRAPYEAEYFFT